MRAFLGVLCVAAAAMALGCGGDGVDRWSGDGCQPACLRQESDGIPVLACVTKGHDIDKCREMEMGNVACAGEAMPTCDTEDGRPRCPGDVEERPICTR